VILYCLRKRKRTKGLCKKRRGEVLGCTQKKSPVKARVKEGKDWRGKGRNGAGSTYRELRVFLPVRTAIGVL